MYLKKVIFAILSLSFYALFVNAESLKSLVLLEGNYNADNIETFGIYADYNDSQIKAKGISIDLKSDNIQIINFIPSSFLNLGTCEGGESFEARKICVDFVKPEGFNNGEELGRFSVRWSKYNGDAEIILNIKYINGQTDFLAVDSSQIYSFKLINGIDRDSELISGADFERIALQIIVLLSVAICIFLFFRKRIPKINFFPILISVVIALGLIGIYSIKYINILPLTGDDLGNNNALAGQRYIDTVFPNVTVHTDLFYGGGFLDMYEPSGDTISKRPVIIFVHGGAFVTGSKEDWQGPGTQFARRGYVTLSVNYQLSDPNTTPNVFTNLFPYEPINKARVDVLSAVRWVRAEASKYRLDSSRIVVIGASAGAVASLYVAYDTDDVGNRGNPGYSSKVSAAVSMAGGMTERDLGTIDAGDPPSLIFHGLNDGIVRVEMVKQVENKLSALGIPYEAYYYPGVDHNVKVQPDVVPKTVNFLMKYVINTIIPTSTPKITNTPRLTPTVSVTVTPSLTIIATATPTPTSTAIPTATPTPVVPIGEICGFIDINFDSRLNIIDFANFAKYYGKDCIDIAPRTGCGGKDTNDDWRIDIQDLIYLSMNYYNIKSDCTRF